MLVGRRPPSWTAQPQTAWSPLHTDTPRWRFHVPTRLGRGGPRRLVHVTLGSPELWVSLGDINI